MEEGKGEEIGMPVRGDNPACSAARNVKLRVVSPIYRTLQCEQLY